MFVFARFTSLNQYKHTNGTQNKGIQTYNDAEFFRKTQTKNMYNYTNYQFLILILFSMQMTLDSAFPI